MTAMEYDADKARQKRAELIAQMAAQIYSSRIKCKPTQDMIHSSIEIANRILEESEIVCSTMYLRKG